MAEKKMPIQLMDTLDGLELTKSEYEWLEQRFAAMTEKEQLLFRGAMELEKPQTASNVIGIANQLHCYELFCGAGDDEALGRFVMEHLEQVSDAARPYISPSSVGQMFRQEVSPACFAMAIISSAAPSPALCRSKSSQASPQLVSMPSASSWPAAPIWTASG